MTTLFHEVYSIYFNTVAMVLNEALSHPVSHEEIRQIVCQNAFKESVLNLVPFLTDHEDKSWQLLDHGKTVLTHRAVRPQTTLEKRWLKTISMGPRIRLFQDELPDFTALSAVEPLFLPEDVNIFDRYDDGDPFEDPAYQDHFRTIMKALRNQVSLEIELVTQHAKRLQLRFMPSCLEYSQKDDKFRVKGIGSNGEEIINVAGIQTCILSDQPVPEMKKATKETQTVVFQLIDQRKALERVLMHFAHFEKMVEQMDENGDCYIVHVTYDPVDEAEMLIRILSFGPMIQVLKPDHFVDLIRSRLRQQMNLSLS